MRGAGSSAPAASPEEQAQRAAGKSPHAAEHEQHEAWAHSQVSGAGSSQSEGARSVSKMSTLSSGKLQEAGSSLRRAACDAPASDMQISVIWRILGGGRGQGIGKEKL